MIHADESVPYPETENWNGSSSLHYPVFRPSFLDNAECRRTLINSKSYLRRDWRRHFCFRCICLQCHVWSPWAEILAALESTSLLSLYSRWFLSLRLLSRCCCGYFGLLITHNQITRYMAVEADTSKAEVVKVPQLRRTSAKGSRNICTFRGNFYWR